MKMERFLIVILLGAIIYLYVNLTLLEEIQAQQRTQAIKYDFSIETIGTKRLDAQTINTNRVRVKGFFGAVIVKVKK